jgi:hypothetical protein
MESKIVCEWRSGDAGPFQSGMRVVVDELAGTISFENCHQPRRFWALRTDPIYTCRLDELLAIHLDWWVVWTDSYRNGRNATISTPQGKAVINSRMIGFQEIVTVLKRHVIQNRGPLLDNPNLWFVGIVVSAVGISIVGLIWALSR